MTPAATEPSPRASRRWRADLALAVGLAALVFAVWVPVMRRGLTLGDEGWLVGGVQRLMGGEALYHDFYRSYAPGAFWRLVPAFAAFGESVLTLRAVALVELAIVALLVFGLARTVLGRGPALWCALVPIVLRPPYHKMFVPLALLAALWLCGRLLVARCAVRRTVAVGFGIGLVGMLRQEAAGYGGIVAALTVLAVELAPGALVERPSVDAAKTTRDGPVLRRVLARWAGLIAGFGLVWVPLFVVLVAGGSAAEVVDQLVLLGLRGNSAMALPFPAPAAIATGPERVLTALFYLPAAAALLGAFVVLRRAARGALTRRELAASQWILFALCVHTVFLSRADFPHLKQALPVAALVVAFLLDTAWRASARRAAGRAVSAALALAAAALLAWGAVEHVADEYDGVAAGEALGEPRAPVVLPAKRVDKLRKVLAEIRGRTDEDDPVFVAPHASMLYVMTGRRNPTRHDSLWPGFASDPAIQDEIVTDLEAARVGLVVYETGARDGREERRFPAYTPRIERYLEENFEVVRRVGGFVVCSRVGAGE